MKFFEQGLDTINHLCRIYDDGFGPIALSIATEVKKILTENPAATKARSTKEFRSPISTVSLNSFAFSKLVYMQFDAAPPAFAFKPVFTATEPEPYETLKFRDWWNRDVVYRPRADVSIATQTVLTRMQFVSLLRNKLGSHQSRDMPRLLDELEDQGNWVTYKLNTPDGVLSTKDGTIPVVTGQLAAIMRQIAFEILQAYGRAE